MKKTTVKMWIFFLLPALFMFGLMVLPASRAQTIIQTDDGEEIIIYPVGSEPKPQPSPVVWEGSTARLGSVLFDSQTRTVTATGWVNQVEGVVEVLACGLRGKVHESIFVLAASPLDLQAALLLAGNKGGEPMARFGEGPPRGSPVDMFVEWEADGETKTARAETFVWDLQKGDVLPDGPWVFTGSILKDGEFKATLEESLIVTFWDPYAIINNPYPNGSNDKVLVVNTRTVPPMETPIRFHIKPAVAVNPLAATDPVVSDPPRIRYGL
ncbi:MAG: YdjY domain-containing protein [Verrucomicrobiota bacterium]|jgi:hypothetical protein|nr:YdjY domain-containing protein [Verrucomicrobiota bacterium]